MILFNISDVSHLGFKEDRVHIERIFLTELREYAVGINKETYELRQKTLSKRFQSAGDISKK